MNILYCDHRFIIEAKISGSVHWALENLKKSFKVVFETNSWTMIVFHGFDSDRLTNTRHPLSFILSLYVRAGSEIIMLYMYLQNSSQVDQ